MTTTRKKSSRFPAVSTVARRTQFQRRFWANIAKSANRTCPVTSALEFGDIESVRAIADRETAAIMLEPIQSMAGVTEAAPEFFRQLGKSATLAASF
jgi:glutamate-1-semialdehyde aminotransferase